MKIARWTLYLIPTLLAELAAWILAPLLALLVDDEGRLPRPLRIFQTADHSAFGDPAHEARWAGRSRYARIVAWLWRNPAYGFSNGPVAAHVSGPIRVAGNLWTSDRPLVEGWCLRQTGDGIWHYYLVRRWGAGFCLRLNLGWKLAGEPGGPNRGQFVCSVNPFLRRSAPSPALHARSAEISRTR